MIQLYNAILEACIAALVLIPLLLILNHFRFRNWKASLLYLMFTVYLAGVYAVVGLPNVTYLRFDLHFNLIPFSGMLSDISGTLLNVVLFIPMGLFLFLLWTPFRRPGNVLWFGFAASLFIEILQIFTLRASDVNDLITNTAGALTGYGIGRLISAILPSLKCRNRISDLPVLLGISVSAMFFLQPVIWSLIY